ncbi:unnamed protein product, partial [Prorocentrum cordatum]
ALANLSLPSLAVPLQRVRVAVLSAQLNSPIDKVVDGKTGLIRDSDPGKLRNKATLDLAHKAEKMMEDARDMCVAHGISLRSKLQLTCENDMRLVLHLLRKGKSSREGKDFATLEEAAQVFIDALADIKGQPIDNPWINRCRATVKQEPKASVAMQQMSDVKSAADQIQRLGYKVGSIIQPRKADQNSSACALWIIKEIGEAIATIAPTGVHADGEPLALVLGNLKDLWVPATAEPQEVLTFSNMLPSLNTSWRIEHVESQICLCLTAASGESEAKFAGLKIYTNPFATQALQDFDPNALVTPPVTQLVKHRGPTTAAPDKSADL